ncbi:NlpC/P60 family protein [Streptacidiphilus sp. MAP5-3]|uniref:C40 family peptidase n=1 Tax=unclassified Streptacidiphilus TaxID=2643834 RepID=UPI0035160725
MASHQKHRKPRTSPLAGPAVRTAATLVTAAAASVVALTQPGHADPKPTPNQVKAQVGELYQQAEQATQQYDGAVAAAQQLQAQAGQWEQEAARTDSRLNRLTSGLDQMAATQYRNGAMDPQLQLLLSADPEDYLQRAGDLSQALASQSDLLQQLATESRTLRSERAAADSRLAALKAEETRLAAAKAQIQEKLGAAQALLNTLTAASLATVTQTGGTTTTPPGLADIPASGRAAAAVAFARAQLGKPYVWGATGPNSYDCSGLVQAAWAAAGVALPRTTYEQIDTGTRIPVSDLQPGDLVFYYSGVSHVGMYVGGGEIIHAPHPGAAVEYAPVDEMPIVGAVRP